MVASDMKKFIINILIFFGIVAVVDFGAGKIFRYLQSHAGGRTGAEWYACKESNEEVIIMGSSRASHHYVPQIITDSLGLSCFNAGQDGNGIILQYGRWKMISERYTPKAVIYDITSVFDMCLNDNMTYMDRLKPFSDNNSIKEYISELFPLERFKLLSQMYCFNYKFIEMSFDCLGQRKSDNPSGYLPEYGHIREEVIEKAIEKKDSRAVDTIKLHCLEKLIKEVKSKGTKIYFVISPYWKGGGESLSAYSSIKELTDKYNVPFIEYISSEICDNPDYFEDSMHLNDNGATEFTKQLVDKIHI